MNTQTRARHLVASDIVAFIPKCMDEPVFPVQSILVEMHTRDDEPGCYELSLGLFRQFLREQTGAVGFLLNAAIAAPAFELHPQPYDPHFSDKICLPELRRIMEECGIRHVRAVGIIMTL